MVGFFAALIGSWGIVGGDDVHAAQAAEIREAGARVTAAPVLEVSDLERYAGRSDTDFSATITVSLKGTATQPKRAPVTLEASTHEEPQRGSSLKVMYAPSDLSLGAVHGDAVTLDRLMSGKAMSPGLTWGLTIAILGVAALLVATTMLTGGFRFVTRLDRDVRALRGSCVGFDRWRSGQSGGNSDNECLLIEDERGAAVHFWVERQAAATAEAARGESGWVCWTAVAQENGGARTPAVLISDSGWVLHGEVWVEEAQELQVSAQPVGSDGAPVDERRNVRLWSPVTAWPLILPLSSVVFVLVAVAAAGACLTDFPARWRWGLGVVTSVALLGALVMYVGPATKRAKGAMRKPSRTVAADARAS